MESTATGLPPEEAGSPTESRSESADQQRIAAADSPRLIGLIQRDRDRAAGRIAVVFQVIEHFIYGYRQLFGDVVDDPDIGLV